MIFLTVGSHEPFDRLVRGVDKWCHARSLGDEVFGQITSRAGYVPTAFPSAPTLSPTDFTKQLEQADCIVSHAGMGTIINCLSRGKPILVLPRRGHLGETRNDHQYATVKQLGYRSGLIVAETEEDLPTQLDHLLELKESDTSLDPYANAPLLDFLRSVIHKRD